MNNNIAKVEQLINESVQYFLERINNISENGPYKKVRKMPSAFPMLNLANEEFYDYAYFERTLEWFVRDYLINDALQKLFEYHKIPTLWPEKKNYVNYRTESIENTYPFEFIINSKEKIGVRYTSLCNNEATSLIEKYELDRIIQIRWSDELTNNEIHQDEYSVFTPETFFKQYLTIEEYSIFISKILSAVEVANSEIGFETIPQLSLRYLSDFKNDISEMILHTDFKTMRFKVLPNSKDIDLSEISFDMNDYNILDKNFIEKGLYKALFGNEGFAKCFITAEYLFQVFKQGHNFDYTSVICGYLKAVEQLIYKLLSINLDYPSSDKLWIKKNSINMPRAKYVQDVTVRPNPITTKLQVVFNKDYKDFFDITLAPMIWFLHDNVNGWEISEYGRLKVHSFLLNFAAECRNDHFHKDNIDDFDVVVRIRNNTLLLIYLLLGGYKLTGQHLCDLSELGIVDDSFDRMYKKMQELPKGINKFVIYFDNQKPVRAYRHYMQEPTNYDKKGSVAASRIRFVAVDDFSGDVYDRAMQGNYLKREFALQKDNMPLRISYINGNLEEIFINW